MLKSPIRINAANDIGGKSLCPMEAEATCKANDLDTCGRSYKGLYDLSGLPAATREAIESSPMFRDWFSKFPEELLGLDSNAKTIKGQAKGIKTAILYLTPADGSGVNLCPMAEIAGCKAACLNLAGRGVYEKNQMSRLRKTLYFLQYRAQFLAQLNREIRTLDKRVTKQGFQLVVRLNGTSDIRWELYGVIRQNPGVQFYDYTKLANRNRRGLPANYDLTFSYSGVPAFAPYVAKAKAAGARIATVFRTKAMVSAMLAAGETFYGLPLVSGDDSDIRHQDPKACIVALYAKGPAKKDHTGFVVG